MNGKSKTKQQLINELETLRRQIITKEPSEADHQSHQNALRENPEVYRTLIETSPDPIVMYSLEGELIAANKQAATMYGVDSTKDLLKEVKTVFDFLTEDGKVYGEASFHRTLSEGRPQRNEYQVKVRDGKIIAAEMHSSIVRTGAGKPWAFISVVRDITARRKAEERLRENEERFRSVVEKSMIGIAVIDHVFKYSYVNEVFCRIAGYEREEILGQDFTYFLSEESKTLAAERIICQPKADNVSSEYEIYFVRKDGEKRLGEVRSVVYLDSFSRKNITLQVIDITKRRFAENELCESKEHLLQSEGRYRSILDNMEEAYYEVDLKGKSTFFNSSAIKSLGYTREEMLGMNYRQYVDEEDIQKVFTAFNRVFRTGDTIRHMEWILRTKAGKMVPIEGSISLIKDIKGNPSGFSGVIRDITDRKSAEDQLRESEEKYRGILENMDDAYYETDLAGNYIFFNEAFMSKTHYTREELTRMNFKSLISPDFHQHVIEAFTEVYKTGKTIRLLEYDVFSKDGVKLNIESWVSPVFNKKNRTVGFKGIARDVTERKQTEKALIENEERFRSLIQNSLDVIVVLDENGLIKYESPSMYRILKYPQGEMIGKNPVDFIHPEDVNAVLKKLAGVLNDRNSGVPITFRFKRADRTWVDIEAVGKNLIGYPVINGIIINARDVSERRKNQEAKLDMEHKLLHAQKMESVGRLAGGVAHDFNNMLSVIMGNVEMAMNKVDSSGAVHKSMQQILSAAKRSAALTRQLLAFARKQAINPKVLDLNDTVSGMLKMLRRLIGEDIELIWHPGYELWKVKVDPSQVDQLLANLIVNARDAIAKTGSIVIETLNKTCDDAYQTIYPYAAPGEYVILTVSDNGCGMDKDQLENIFEPFFTTKKEGQGTGLGLATVYGIVKQNNGFINVISEPQRGATFQIFLPRHKGMDHEDVREEPEAETQGGQETILIIEDEQSVLNISRAMLEMLGYKVLAANGKDEALCLAHEYRGKIDLLLSDVVLPGMNGKELSEQIIKIRPGLKRLYMSGYPADVIARQGILDKNVKCISKPFSLQDMAARVREVLDT